MDLLPVIDAWLKHPVFLTGRELYARYGANESYKRLFARREDQGAFTVLIEAIRELREHVPSEPVKALPVKQPSLPSEATDAPEPVQALINQRKSHWAEVVHLKNVLRQSDSQEERAKAAFRILDLRKKINDIWYQTNYYDSKGTLPELPSEEQLDAQLEKLDDLTLRSTYQNNQKYLSKYAKRDRTPAVQAEYIRRQEQQPKIEQIQKARKESQSIQF